MAESEPIWIDTRSQLEHQLGHVPSARHLELTAPRIRLRDDDELQALASGLAEINSRLALSPGAHLICYDQGLSARLARTAFFLLFGGHDLELMTGGFEELLTETGEYHPEPIEPWVDLRTEYLLTAEQVRDFPRILDVRTREEYQGRQKAACDPRSGRIPGAEFAPLDLFFEPNSLLSKIKVEPGEPVGVYCHSGARSSVAFFILRSLGVPARNYLGSMHEWSSEPDLPVETD